MREQSLDYMKPVHSQSQPLWFKVLSGILGLGAALASAFFVFSLMRLELFSQPINIFIGIIIALLMVILIAMQFGLTTSTYSKIGISLLTVIVTLIMGGASLFFFQEAGWSFSSSSSTQSNTSRISSSQSSFISHSDSSYSNQEHLETRTIEKEESGLILNPPLDPPNSNELNPIDEEAINSSSSSSIHEVIVDKPLYISEGDDALYVDEPLYVPPQSDVSSLSSQDSPSISSSF